MAGLTKRPKIPKQPTQIVKYVSASSSDVTNTQESASDTSSTEDTSKDVREESLLRRSRGRLGTIFTGFRGLLGEAKDTPRKSLLGE